MKTKTLQLESKLLGGKVMRISDWDFAGEVIEADPVIIEKHQPRYLYLEVDATDLSTIQQLEDTGYRFSEFRMTSLLLTDETEPGTKGLYPYTSELLGDEEQLQIALNLLKQAHDDDRFSNDPAVGAEFSKKRVLHNLKKSFNSFPNEFILGVFNSQTEELLAFRSGAFINQSEAIYYQYAVAPGHEFNHMADMLEVFTIDFLKQRGIKIIYAVSTGFNIDELNRLVKNHNFTIQTSTVLLRKFFPPLT